MPSTGSATTHSVSTQSDTEPLGPGDSTAELEDRSSRLDHASEGGTSSNRQPDDLGIEGRNDVIPSKSGEIGWRASVHMVALPQVLDVPQDNSTPSSATRNLKRTLLKILERLPPGTFRLVSFLISLLMIIITVEIFLIVSHRSKSSSNAPLSLSPKNTTSVPATSQDFSGNYVGSNYTSNSTDSQGEDITSVPTDTLTFILLLMVLGLEIIFVWSRLSALYAFHRSRHLLEILSYTVSPDPELNLSSPSLRRREYIPRGPIRLLEFFLALPPRVLVPALIPPNHSPSASGRRDRSVTLLPEDQIIARDLKEGAAPLYNGVEMNRDQLISQAPSTPSRGPNRIIRNEYRTSAERIPLPSFRPGSMSSTIRWSRISRRNSDTTSLRTDALELPLSARSFGGRAPSPLSNPTSTEGLDRVRE